MPNVYYLCMRIVEESDYGVYAWVTEDNKVVCNDSGDILCIASQRNDLRKMSELGSAARYYGINGGRPVFLSGRRKISESEYQDQIERAKNGLIPDPYDGAAYLDELRGRMHG